MEETRPGQRLGDRLPDRGAEHGEDGGGDGAGVPADRLADGVLDRRGERAGQLPVAPGAEGDRLRQELGQLLAGEPGRVEPPLELLQPAPLGAEDQLAQLREVRRGSVIARAGGGLLPGCPLVGHRLSSGGRSSPAPPPVRLPAEPGGHVGEQRGQRGRCRSWRT